MSWPFSAYKLMYLYHVDDIRKFLIFDGPFNSVIDNVLQLSRKLLSCSDCSLMVWDSTLAVTSSWKKKSS